MVEVGANYTLTAFAKSSTADACSVGLAYSDSSGNTTRKLIPFTGAWGGDWQSGTLNLTLPYGSTFMAVYLGGNAGTCSFDNLALSVPSTAAPQPAASTWVVNGDFETGSAGGVPAPWGAGTLVAPGRRSGQAFSNAHWSWTQQNIAASTVADFTAGQNYTLVASGRAVNGGACSVLFQGGDDNTVLFSTVLDFRSSTWTGSSIAGTFPAGLRWAAVVLTTTDPECQFDDVSVGTPTPLPSTDTEVLSPDEITAVVAPSVTPPSAFLGEELTFSGRGSVGNDLSYRWDFGDGTSAVGDPEASGETVHSYATPGYYTAKLRVTDAPTSTIKTTEYKVAIMPDVSDMASSRIVNVNGTLTFDVKYPLPNLTYEWTFDDGTVLQGPAVTKTVTRGGFTAYTLRAFDGTLDEDGQRHVVVQDEARYNAALPPLEGAVMGIYSGQWNVNAFRAYFNFPDDGTNVRIVSYDWDFGDGQRQTTTDSTVSHTYSRSSVYGLVLKATDNYGRQVTLRHAVVLQNLNTANFYLQACLNTLIGTCQWPQPPVTPSPCPTGKGPIPSIVCGNNSTPSSTGESQPVNYGIYQNFPPSYRLLVRRFWRGTGPAFLLIPLST